MSLLNAMRAEMADLYDDLDIDAGNMPKAGPAQFAPPRGDFLIGIDSDGHALCCGGIKPLPDGDYELRLDMARLPATWRSCGKCSATDRVRG